MSPHQFRAAISLFAEAALLLTRSGRILAANAPVTQLGLNPNEIIGKNLSELLACPSSRCEEYLRSCSRSAQPVVGALAFPHPEGGELKCRCAGLRIAPDSPDDEPQLLIKFTPQQSATAQFPLLRQKIAELTEEVRRRRQLEDDIREHRESLQVTLASIGDGVIVTDTCAKIVYLNPVAERLTGWTQAEAKDQPLENVFQIVNEYTRDRVDNPVMLALNEGRIVGLANHTLLISRDGTERAIDDSAAPILREDGSVFGVVLVFRDVTSRRRAETALRESERRFRLLADSAPSLIWMSDTNARCTFFNKPWLEFTGRTMDEERGDGWLAGVHPDDSHRCLQAYRDAIEARESFQVDFRLRRADGAYRWLINRGTPWYDSDGRFSGFIGSCIDISERKAAEESMHRSEELFRAVFEVSPSGIVLADPESGRLLRCNQKYCELVGYSQEELHRLSFRDITHPDDRDADWRNYQRLVHGEIPEYTVEKRYVRKDGGVIWVRLNCVVLRDENGVPMHDVTVVSDITERRRLEERLRNQVQELAEAEERVRSVVEHVLDGIITIDEHGIVQSFNPAAETLFGYLASEVVGQNIKMLMPEPYRSEHDEYLRSYLTTGNAKIIGIGREVEGLRSDGTTFPMELAVSELQLDNRRCFTGIIRNITERKRTELALRQSEELFRTLASNAPAAIFIKDVEGRYTFANLLACQVLGRSDVVGKTDEELMDPDAAAAVRKNDAEVIRHGNAIEREELVRVGGTGYSFLSVKFPLVDAEDRIVGVCGVSVDITARKRAEEARRETEEKFRLLSDSMPQLAWMARPDGYIFWYNRRWYEYTGMTPEESEGWGWQSAVEPGELQRVIKRFKGDIARGISWEDTFPLRRHDGAMRWHLSRAVPARDEQGRILLWFGTNTDITERKRTEAMLQFLADASETLSTLVDSRRTLQTVAELAVRGFADWCAVDIVEEDGSLNRLAIAHADPRKRRISEEYRRRHKPRRDDPHKVGYVLRTGMSEIIPDLRSIDLEETITDPESRRLLEQMGLGSLICVPLAAHNRILGALTFVTSRVDHPYTTDDLKVAEDLAHRATIAIENALLYEDIRNADRRKDEFLAMLAHELRNPLAPIRSGLDILALETEGANDTVMLMLQQVEHMVRLVDDLLDVSRIMRGKVALRKEPIELADVVRRALATVRSLIDGRQQLLQVSLPDEPVWLDADPVRLTQVISNLLNNASKYSEAGGRIELTVAARESDVEIQVKDDGIGIEKELLPKVFDLFTQASTSIDRSQGGLGIGLTLVRNLVEMHNGSVTARSDGLGKGCTFTVVLPRIPAPAETACVPEPESTMEPRKIVVVDDSVGSAKMLRLLILHVGEHQVEMAHDGPSAVETALRVRPDIIFLDIGLPGMSGYEVVEELRRHPEFQETFIYALTGYGQEDDYRKSKEAGFDEHVVKPVDVNTLKRLLSARR